MPEEHLSEDERQEIISCVRSGSKIEAIKIYRRATGADLAESKHVIETLATEMSENAPLISDTDQNAVVTLLNQGNKIAAIKLYREKTGTGLKEAKNKVDDLAASLGIGAPPLSQKKGPGCAACVFISVAWVAAVCLMLWRSQN